MLSTKAIALSVLSLAASSVAAYESDWKAIGGSLIQVSFDGHQVCGVSPSNVILCATDNLDSTPVWQPIAGPAGKPGFKWVALWGANLWAVNTNDEIWYGQSSGDPNWVQLPGSLKQISADGKQICGCNKDNQIWCADQGITSNPQWRQLPGALTQLDLTDGVIYGVAPDDSIWFGMSDGEPSFTRISGGLRQIAFDGELLCGTNSAMDIYCADSGLKSSPNWRNIPGKLTQLDVQAGRVFGVNSANNIWHKYFTKPLNMWDGWRVVQGKTFTAINYDGKSICGVDPNQDVYCATNGFHDGSTQWRQLNGTKLMKVAVWGDSIWGVDKANNIWYGQMNGDPQWRQVSGSLKQISTDGKQICGCNSNDDIWCADTNITTTPNWRNIPGKLQHLSVLNGVLFGTNHDNNIFTGRATGDPKWIQLQGQLATLEYDGRSLCGVNAGGDIWCSDSGLQQGTPNWRRLDTGYLYASVNGGKMFVITGTGTLLTRMDL